MAKVYPSLNGDPLQELSVFRFKSTSKNLAKVYPSPNGGRRTRRKNKRNIKKRK